MTKPTFLRDDCTVYSLVQLPAVPISVVANAVQSITPLFGGDLLPIPVVFDDLKIQVSCTNPKLSKTARSERAEDMAKAIELMLNTHFAEVDIHEF